MKLLKIIQGCRIALRDDGVIDFTADADIDADGGPNIDSDLCWAPDTSLHYQGKPINAQTVPYVVIPIGILNLVWPVGLGCECTVTHTLTGKSATAVLADLGPTRKVGEISPALARIIGVNPNSVNGGEERWVIRYEVRIGKAAVVNGICYDLQPLHKR